MRKVFCASVDGVAFHEVGEFDSVELARAHFEETNPALEEYSIGHLGYPTRLYDLVDGESIKSQFVERAREVHGDTGATVIDERLNTQIVNQIDQLIMSLDESMGGTGLYAVINAVHIKK